MTVWILTVGVLYAGGVTLGEEGVFTAVSHCMRLFWMASMAIVSFILMLG